MLGFIAWLLLIWAALAILSSFVMPFMIGKPRKPYTAATASASMAANIIIGLAIIILAASSLNGVSA